MLQQLVLENFKGLKKAVIDFGRITVLIGPNGTGKSSISHALMVLRQSIGGDELKVSGPLINLGSFNDVLTKGTSKKTIGLTISVGVGEYPALNITEKASYSYKAHFNPKLINFDAEIGGPGKKYLTAKETRSSSGTVEPNAFTRKLPSGEISIKLVTQKLIVSSLLVGRLFHTKGLDDEAEAFEEQVTEYLSAIKALLSNTYYVPAIRGLEQPNYALANKPTMDFAPGQNAELASTFAYAGTDIKEMVSRWSESITGSTLAAPVVPGRNVAITSYAVPEGIPVIGDGFGTNQLVRLLLTLAITPRHSVLAIEEPEIHLHPKAQEMLCDILVETAKAQDKQIVLTTHSEHVLYRFVSAVRIGTLARHELAIYYFEEKGGEPQQVEQDKYGDIYDWGKNFFSLS